MTSFRFERHFTRIFKHSLTGVARMAPHEDVFQKAITVIDDAVSSVTTKLDNILTTHHLIPSTASRKVFTTVELDAPQWSPGETLSGVVWLEVVPLSNKAKVADSKTKNFTLDSVIVELWMRESIVKNISYDSQLVGGVFPAQPYTHHERLLTVVALAIPKEVEEGQRYPFPFTIHLRDDLVVSYQLRDVLWTASLEYHLQVLTKMGEEKAHQNTNIFGRLYQSDARGEEQIHQPIYFRIVPPPFLLPRPMEMVSRSKEVKVGGLFWSKASYISLTATLQSNQVVIGTGFVQVRLFIDTSRLNGRKHIPRKVTVTLRRLARLTPISAIPVNTVIDVDHVTYEVASDTVEMSINLQLPPSLCPSIKSTRFAITYSVDVLLLLKGTKKTLKCQLPIDLLKF